MAIIGLCGAHRVGKTTLCRKLEDYGVEFVKTDVSEVLAIHGIDSSTLANASLDVFVEGQNIIMRHFSNIINRLKNNKDREYVLDRTPIDAIAYFRARFSSARFQSKDSNLINAVYNPYICCGYLTAMLLDKIVLVQPGIDLVEEDGKAAANPDYIDFINTLILGDLEQVKRYKSHRSGWVTIMPRHIISLEERIDFLLETAVYKNTD